MVQVLGVPSAVPEPLNSAGALVPVHSCSDGVEPLLQWARTVISAAELVGLRKELPEFVQLADFAASQLASKTLKDWDPKLWLLHAKLDAPE